LLSAYRPEKHPSVEKGAKTPEQVRTDLITSLQPYVKQDRVSAKAFADFHRVGASFESDYDFDQTAESVWGRAVASEKVDSSDDALAVLRKALNERGVRGVVSLARNFRLADQDGSGSLREGEFIRSLQLSQCQLEPKQVSLLFRSFDTDRDGVIDQAEFLTKLRGPMNARRVALVDQAFDVLDTDKNGIVEPSEVVAKYDASKHADVLQGKKTEQEVLREFLDTFDVGGVVDGKVTRQEFRNYYHSVSSGIELDDAFELCIRNAWHLSGGEGWCANSTNLRVLVTHADGTQTVECVEDDLGLEMPRDAIEIIDRLRKQGLDVVSVQAGAGPVISKPIPVKEVQHERVSNDEALETLRKALKKRGVRGLTNLGRAFRIADADHSRVLSKEELQRCLNRADVWCEDFDTVYSLFDKDGNGKVDYDEFLRTLRGPMGDRRRALVTRPLRCSMKTATAS
jgi:Ca2+-binding EF-hand superfamily protein